MVDRPVSDRLGRPLGDLRISVTDRCNFRCAYCMPREVYGPDHPFLARAELLTFEEIERLAFSIVLRRQAHAAPPSAASFCCA